MEGISVWPSKMWNGAFFVGKDHLLTMKKSRLSNHAGFGLFAARRFEMDETMAFYCGHDIFTWGNRQKKKSTKSLKAGDGNIYVAKDDDIWIGAHFCNDPSLSEKREQGRT